MAQKTHQQSQKTGEAKAKTSNNRLVSSIKSSASKLKFPQPVVNLRNDLMPLVFEVKSLRKQEQEVPVLGGKKTVTTKVSRKMHLLQLAMAAQEMVLTRRARRSARIQEKYLANQTKLGAEFATLNPEMKKYLSEQAKKALTEEIVELDKTKTNRETRRKRTKAMKAKKTSSAPAKATRK